MMNDTTVFKIRKNAHKELKLLAVENDRTMIEMIQDLIDFYKENKKEEELTDDI